MIRAQDHAVVSFDCYGTLIDWESGILGALRPILSAHDAELEDERILEMYADLESWAEQGDYVSYREVLRQVTREFGRRSGFVPSAAETDCLADSLPHWRPFPDTLAALRTLRRHFSLAIISNVDRDLLAATVSRLEVAFDWLVTAEEARCYKPAHRMFELALEKTGTPPRRVVHVAQSVYHDVVPATRLGFTCVWVNRRKGKTGSGATPPAFGQPDLEVPDLKSLVTIFGLE